MKNLTKEWKNKLAFLKEELQYIYFKLKRLNNTSNLDEKWDEIELFTEQVKSTLLTVDAQSSRLEKDDITRSIEASLKGCLIQYEHIKSEYEALLKDIDLTEVA